MDADVDGPRSPRGLSTVFAPRSVVVVGASGDPAKRGHQILRSLLHGSFSGTVYAVNPRGGEILGHPVYRRVEELPEAPELAVICTPGPSTPDVIEACGHKGIGGAVILAVGFRETGNEGAALEERVRVAAEHSGVRVVGPNTSGILNLPLGMNLIGAPGVRPGGLSLLVQSGNMALALMKEASFHDGPGVAVCAGLGNEADVGFGECLAWLGGDESTRAVLCYAEGMRRPRAFLTSAARITREKPVLLLGAGRTPDGARAARSHTGAVAGPFDRFAAGLRQAGVVVATRTDELVPLAETLALQPPAPKGTGVAVLSDGGGHGTLAADALAELGVPLAPLSPLTRGALADLLGPSAATGNPVDLAGAGDADPEVFPSALRILLGEPTVGAVLTVGLFGGYAERFDERLRDPEIQAASGLAEAARGADKGLVVHSLYAPDWPEPLAVLRRAEVPVVASLDVACRCVAELWRRGRFLAESPWRPEAAPVAGPTLGGSALAPSDFEPVLRPAREDGRETLTEVESRTLLEAVGVPVPPGLLCRTAQEASSAQERFGGPVALKVVSPGISHKTEAGGVALRVLGEEAVEAAFHRILERGRAHLRGRGAAPDIEGVLVTPMQPPPLAELLVGVSRDPGLGPVLTLGAGGTWVEWLDDVGHRVLPVDASGIQDLLRGLRVASVLGGARGGAAGDEAGVVAAASALARLVQAVPEIAEVEINPLFVYPDRVVPVDVRIFLGAPPG